MTDRRKTGYADALAPRPLGEVAVSSTVHPRNWRRRHTIARLTLWAGAIVPFYMLAAALAAALHSWLIGCIGAGVAALLALAMLSAAKARNAKRRS